MIDPKINLRSKSAISAQINNNAGIALAWLNLAFLVERQLFPQLQHLGTQFRPVTRHNRTN
jgi:hypothetical protein